MRVPRSKLAHYQMRTQTLREATEKWNPDERLWLERFRECLTADYGGVVTRAVVFGSKARGDAHEGSDIDVMVIVKDTETNAQDPILDMATDLVRSAHCWNAVPSVKTRTESDWREELALQRPFHANVERECISIFEEEIGTRNSGI